MFSFPKSLPSFFTDEALQKKFEEEGFVIIDFYNHLQVEKLEAFFASLKNIPKTGFFPTTFLKENAIREKIHEFVVATAQPSLTRFFRDIKIVHGSFIIKNPGKPSELRLHQDMSLVDESRFSGVNIWCPLIDLDTTNGALYVLPKSHRIFPTYRGASIPNSYDKHTGFIKDYLQPQYLKAGQAVVFDQSIIHYSPPNLSDKIRITTNIFITQREAEYRMYYFDKSKEKQVEVFLQQDDFMTQFQQFGYDIYARPTLGKSKGFTDYNFPEISPEKMEALYGKLPQKNLFEKVKEKINGLF